MFDASMPPVEPHTTEIAYATKKDGSSIDWSVVSAAETRRWRGIEVLPFTPVRCILTEPGVKSGPDTLAHALLDDVRQGIEAVELFEKSLAVRISIGICDYHRAILQSWQQRGELQINEIGYVEVNGERLGLSNAVAATLPFDGFKISQAIAEGVLDDVNREHTLRIAQLEEDFRTARRRRIEITRDNPRPGCLNFLTGEEERLFPTDESLRWMRQLQQEFGCAELLAGLLQIVRF